VETPPGCVALTVLKAQRETLITLGQSSVTRRVLGRLRVMAAVAKEANETE